jgi:hypothetical protein
MYPTSMPPLSIYISSGKNAQLTSSIAISVQTRQKGIIPMKSNEPELDNEMSTYRIVH